MCGIFAYSGPRDVKKILIEGLKGLEYRGYDSAGVAFFKKDRIHRFRVCGGVSELEKKINITSQKDSLGIGHTRWATHGSPSEVNAHPHRCDLIYVVHNGVIENEEEIKTIINPKSLSSETDTELIPHLIHHFYKTGKLSFLQSVFKTISGLKGAYAALALCEKNPDEIIAFTSGPPLVVCRGRGKREFFVSSDPYAVGDQALDMFFLEDEEVLFYKNSQFQIFNFKGKKISRKFKKVSLNQEENTNFQPHFMLKEILEQPKILSGLVNQCLNKDKRFFSLKLTRGKRQEFDKVLKKTPSLFILACGSSYHAALFAKYLLEEISGVQTHAEIASEFIYRKAVIPPDTPVLLISQSGETADILTALKQVKSFGLSAISLHNTPNSSLDRKSDFVIPLLAGPEVAVASTKTFSSSLMVLSFLAFHIAKLKGSLFLKQERDFVKHLLAFPSHMRAVLNCDVFFLKMVKKLKKFKAFFYLGRGIYYPIALEGALKLKEVVYLHAEAYPSGEMKHGPLAMIDKHSMVVALLPHTGILYQKSLINLKEAKSRGSCIISIGGKNKDKKLQELSDEHLFLPETHDLLHPLLTLVPLQMMAYYMGRSYGYNVDRPRNLAKSVTVE